VVNAEQREDETGARAQPVSSLEAAGTATLSSTRRRPRKAP
jgi:hypothetical protein